MVKPADGPKQTKFGFHVLVYNPLVYTLKKTIYSYQEFSYCSIIFDKIITMFL